MFTGSFVTPIIFRLLGRKSHQLPRDALFSARYALSDSTFTAALVSTAKDALIGPIFIDKAMMLAWLQAATTDWMTALSSGSSAALFIGVTHLPILAFVLQGVLLPPKEFPQFPG